ncbi:Chromosome partition protein smc [Labilithrix luteola]|uniref:Chromosome partition protein smc n=1 Tax=Labilithrix luteola TaxID=1391654 RepID=A0A0K1PZT0_9BACT|nr:thioredoxin family protein [Labilithrix luteola]AKU98659.1 Chromosome partition protein smc [Labilithrix luteola]
MIGSSRFASFAALTLGSSLALAGCASGGASVQPASQTTASAAKEALPFIHDDFPRALAEAKQRGKPLFVDAWAPWCHSCLSMRAFVLTDPSLAPLANDYVWLTIDTEKDENGAFVSRFPNDVWPTLWVIDPAREHASLKWGGTATADELRELLASTKGEGSEGAQRAEGMAAFRRGNEAASKGEVAEAERQFRASLAVPSHPQRARAVEALVSLLSSRDDFGACADLAASESASLPSGTSRATVLATGLSCATEGKRTALVASLSDACLRAASDPDPHAAADDRSGLYEAVVEAKKASGDAAGAKAVAQTWAAFLEREAVRAPTKQARAVFDPHRLSAYIALGDPERAVPMLQESERDFPEDYNPPARLARAYFEMKRWGDAKAASDRASAKVYGPRALRVFVLAADVAKAQGDVAGERKALENGLVRTERSVLNDKQKKLRASLADRLAALPR